MELDRAVDAAYSYVCFNTVSNKSSERCWQTMSKADFIDDSMASSVLPPALFDLPFRCEHSILRKLVTYPLLPGDSHRV